MRSAVLPIDSLVLRRDRTFMSFLDELSSGDLASAIWWEGLALRSDRVHATLAPAIGETAIQAPTGSPIVITVRGPWIGRFNIGRIYLPVEVPHPAARTLLREVRDQLGARHQPLLAGYLQLTRGLEGSRYEHLKAVVREYQSRVAVDITIDHLAVTETMDDLVLRSRVVDRVRLTGTP